MQKVVWKEQEQLAIAFFFDKFNMEGGSKGFSKLFREAQLHAVPEARRRIVGGRSVVPWLDNAIERVKNDKMVFPSLVEEAAKARRELEEQQAASLRQKEEEMRAAEEAKARNKPLIHLSLETGPLKTLLEEILAGQKRIEAKFDSLNGRINVATVQKPQVAADVRKRRIVVLGLLSSVHASLIREFGEKFSFKFVEATKARKIQGLGKGYDHIFSTRFINHDVLMVAERNTGLRVEVISNGQAEALRQRLRQL